MAKYELVIPIEITEKADQASWGVASLARDVLTATLSEELSRVEGIERIHPPEYRDSSNEALHDRSRDRMERDYWEDVRGVAQDFIQAVKDGEVTDDEDAHTWLHETIDEHRRVFITALAQECLRFSPNDGKYIEDFGADGAATDGGIEWSRLAFCAFEADVHEQLDAEGYPPHDPDEWNAEEDEDEETEEAEEPKNDPHRSFPESHNHVDDLLDNH